MAILTGILLAGNSEATEADMRYALGCGGIGGIALLQLEDGRKYLLAPAMEAARARRELGRRVAVLSPADLNIKSGRSRKISEWVLALLERGKVSRVNVPPEFPIGLADALRRCGISVRVMSGRPFSSRAVKTRRELEHIAAAQRAAVRAMRLAAGMLRDSRVDRRGFLVLNGRRLVSEFLRDAVELELCRLGMRAQDTIVSGGVFSADPHERGSGPLRCGEPIVVDIFPQSKSTGYWGDLTRTFVKGKASPALLKMYEAVKAAQAAAFKTLRVGVFADAPHKAASAEFERRGFRTEMGPGRPRGFIHGLGHGVGLEVHEAPWLSPAGAGMRLRSRNVVTVEPGLYYPEIGGVRIEDIVVIRAGGWEAFASCEESRFEL